MKFSSLPQEVLARVMSMEAAALALATQADKADKDLNDCREVMSGRRTVSDGGQTFKAIKASVAQARENFDGLLNKSKQLRQRANIEQRVLSSCKLWLEQLPEGSHLEPIQPDLEGHSLTKVREEIVKLHTEIGALKSAPFPSEDIKQRVTQYVHNLAQCGRPYVQGINQGQQLSVHFPIDERALSSRNLDGYSNISANPLYLFAAMNPDWLVKKITQAINEQCAFPCPPPQRAQKLIELNDRLTDLLAIEGALIEQMLNRGDDVTRDVNAPAWAVLQISKRKTVMKKFPWAGSSGKLRDSRGRRTPPMHDQRKVS